MKSILILNFLAIFLCFSGIKSNIISSVENESTSDVIDALSANDEVVNLDRTKKAVPTEPIPTACVEFRDEASGNHVLQCEDNSLVGSPTNEFSSGVQANTESQKPAISNQIASPNVQQWITNPQQAQNQNVQQWISNAQQNQNVQQAQQTGMSNQNLQQWISNAGNQMTSPNVQQWITNPQQGQNQNLQQWIANAQQNRNSQISGAQQSGFSSQNLQQWISNAQQTGAWAARQMESPNLQQWIDNSQQLGAQQQNQASNMQQWGSTEFEIAPDQLGQILQSQSPAVNVGAPRGYGYGAQSAPISYGPCSSKLLFSCQPSVVTVPCGASAPSYPAPSYSVPAPPAYSPSYKQNVLNPSDDRPKLIRSIRYF